MTTTPRSDVHISSRVVCFGGAAGCFAGITALSVAGDLVPLRQAALYCFAVGLPFLTTAGLVFEFIGYRALTEEADRVAQKFTRWGSLMLIAGISMLLASVHWSYAAVFLAVVVISFVVMQTLLRKYSS